MSGNGFYRRRRGLLEHLQSGTITLFDAGVHDFICLNAQSRVGTGSSIPPGIWFGSATKLWLLTGRRESKRRIQRSLEKLERIGWIKRFRCQGKRGDYPILISRFVVTDASGSDFIVNGDATTDWRHPSLEPYTRSGTDVSLKRRRTVVAASPLLQDLYTKRQEPSVRAQAPSSNGFEVFWSTYPKKVGKPEAVRAWKKVEPQEVPNVLAGLERWKGSEQWSRDGGQYIPYPATFLNKRRWEDEAPSSSNDKPVPPSPEQNELTEEGRRTYERHGIDPRRVQ